ncbi:polyphosphate kinase 2 family protein [Sphingobium chlorophenolicum]|uniref:UDP-galactose-lipid carrier transferase MED92 n=1 Tax=Sphingobium chlorophenolicum TaxID=46429 RepID=A0A081RCT5_SPHCR|nr:polyphosphate kinase [Sphingobium chlorophenolicum]KEQ53008.1 UDP-galactose-lipid carrier transferase MED92 [Sphingobium chlorophenolicum]
MTIDLADFEKGAKFKGDYEARLAELQERLAKIQVAHIIHDRRSVILLEGWDAAGKGGIIKRMSAQWDPRYYNVHPISAPTEEERDRHFLWRFWTRLPAGRNIAIFDRSWYGRVLVERVEGFCSKGEWKRAYDEINAFEKQQVDAGTNIVKLFIHITQEVQDEQLAERLDTPWKRWKTGADDYRNRARRADYLDAMHEMFRKTDTKAAPWHAIDNNHRRAGRIAALDHVAERLEKLVPMDFPEADPEVVKLATKAYGYKKIV